MSLANESETELSWGFLVAIEQFYLHLNAKCAKQTLS